MAPTDTLDINFDALYSRYNTDGHRYKSVLLTTTTGRQARPFLPMHNLMTEPSGINDANR